MSAIVLDVETTGVNPHQDRVIEIAIVDFDTGDTLLHSLCNPEREIPPDITELTGITNDMALAAPFFHAIADEAARQITLADAIVAHNPWFDQRMISAELGRLGLAVRWPILICTKRIWDLNEPREQRHLTNAFKRFVSKDGFEGAHGALADTTACRQVLLAQLKEFDLEGKPWNELDPEQTTWFGPSNHVLWSSGILVVNFGKHKGRPCHEVERSYWEWIRSQEFPEHIMVLADYMSVVAPADLDADRLATWAYGRVP